MMNKEVKLELSNVREEMNMIGETSQERSNAYILLEKEFDITIDDEKDLFDLDFH